MSNGNGHRWSKFWWQDWQNDPALRMCSLAAQGLWMRLLCVMHEATPVGHLLVNGRQPTTRQVAALAASPEKEVALLLRELEEAGVYSRTDEGVIYSRRMVRDAAASDAGREHIAKRWDNSHPKAPPNRSPNRGATQKPNGAGDSPPNTLESEAESEAESSAPKSPPPDGAGDAPPLRGRDPNAPRSDGFGQKFGTRADGTNPRARGTNPRSRPPEKPAYRNGFHVVDGGYAGPIIEGTAEETTGPQPIGRALGSAMDAAWRRARNG